MLSSFLLGFSIGTVLVVAALWFNIFNWPLPTFSTIFEASSHPGLSGKLNPKEGSRTPHLVSQDAVGAINEPLPLGIVVNDSSGGETLVLSDLVEGTQLSAGTALSPTRWSIPARDLDKTFIAAPENFSGSMQVSAKLYSSDNLVLETKNVRFEWIGSQTEGRAARTDVIKAAPETSDPTSKDTIEIPIERGPISDHRTEDRRVEWTRSHAEASPLIAPPLESLEGTAAIRFLKGAGPISDMTRGGAEAKWWALLGPGTADWVYQVSSVLLPLDDHVGPKPLAVYRKLVVFSADPPS